MSLLIDGYNLLFAIGVRQERLAAPGGLQRARRGLLGMLAASLPPEVAARTTVVFDAAAAPPGLPDREVVRGLSVRYAVGYESADALLEELIRADSAPKRLTVVSSDHRVQQAARRRKAEVADSQAWYDALQTERRKRPQPADADVSPPQRGTPSDDEIEYWLEQFAEAEAEAAGTDVVNPFPPGYAEDVEEV
jgi:predicted RNA-binding protein with PIN domain